MGKRKSKTLATLHRIFRENPDADEFVLFARFLGEVADDPDLLREIREIELDDLLKNRPGPTLN